jgi:NAD(P)-dependent dehydrogenase (short-subunit alcohol dehydrogenase family)
LFALQGWRAVTIDLEAPVRIIEGVECWQADLSNPEEITGLVGRFEGEIGRLGALVNNAAIQVLKPILETTSEEWDRTLRVNLGAVFELARGMHKLLKSSRGAIVNVSSVHAMATSPGIAAYAASKGALLALTRSMALEFGRDGIRVNAVLPGAVDTKMLRAGLERPQYSSRPPDQRMIELGARTALGRVGRPEEIAQAILFLADSKRASYITGQALVVDGGALAALSTE